MRGLLLLAVLPLRAHVMSMSTGDAIVDGKRVEYTLRIPMYEVAHTRQPETALLAQVRFVGGSMQHSKCFQQGESYLCAADYLFDAPVQRLDVTCTLYSVTVPNHVHMLRARKGDREDQAFFDYTFTEAKLTFQPPSVLRTTAHQLTEGAFRALAGAIQILFLASLILAARNRPELVTLSGAFAIGLVAGALMKWHPSPRFAECAAALSVAYLAVEVLFLPQGGGRWLVAAVLGVFQGLYLAFVLARAPGYTLAGAATADLAFCLLGGFFLVGRLPRLAASLPLVAGLGWFFVRLAT